MKRKRQDDEKNTQETGIQPKEAKKLKTEMNMEVLIDGHIELLSYIGSFLDDKSRAVASSVNWTFYQAMNSPVVYLELIKRSFPGLELTRTEDLKILYLNMRHLVRNKHIKPLLEHKTITFEDLHSVMNGNLDRINHFEDLNAKKELLIVAATHDSYDKVVSLLGLKEKWRLLSELVMQNNLKNVKKLLFLLKKEDPQINDIQSPYRPTIIELLIMAVKLHLKGFTEIKKELDSVATTIDYYILFTVLIGLKSSMLKIMLPVLMDEIKKSPNADTRESMIESLINRAKEVELEEIVSLIGSLRKTEKNRCFIM